jgi:Zn-dependent M28 family amino/carboxypeptidase
VKTRLMTVGAVAALLVAVIAMSSSAGAGAESAQRGSPTFQGSAKLRKALTVRGILGHLRQLQSFADANGGTRAAGFPGFTASADYVAQTMEDAGWQVTRQPFDFDFFFEDAPTTFEQVSPDPATYTEDVDYATTEFSGSGNVTAALVAVDLTFPPTPEPSSSSGCEPSDFDGLAITGRVALIQRGTCDFRVKVDNAAAAGAAAVVLFNEGQEGRRDVINGTLGGPNAAIPTVDTSFALGSDLANGVENGPTGTRVHIQTTTHSEVRTAENVIAQTRTGDPDNVVMAGAHLDSVFAGPGINDNGSGSATLLELGKQISNLNIHPDQRLRFAWWGAEEEGLVGSGEYVSSLTRAMQRRIALYLNFDMIASPNFARLIYDGNGSKFETPGPAGSDAIERTFERYFDRVGLASGQTAFDGRSDYGPFTAVGIPAGGLFTGAEDVKSEAEQAAYGGTAGEAFDPCYHKACDDINNLSVRALNQMSDAVADAVNHYAFSLDFIPRENGSGASKAKVASRKGTQSKYVGDLLRK